MNQRVYYGERAKTEVEWLILGVLFIKSTKIYAHSPF